MATPQPEQLVLALPHRQALDADDFLVSQSNADVVALIDRWPDWPSGVAVIIGAQGAGKSHLANVWRQRSGACLIEAGKLTTASVGDLTSHPGVVLENLSQLLDQTALFHLLNLVRETRLTMLLTSDRLPGDLPFTLPDLTSRLKALPTARFELPDDALLRAVLVKQFADRQLTVEPHVIDYILRRMERSMAGARSIVDAVDRRALTLQRGVTRAVAAAALSTLGIKTSDGD